MIKSIKGERIFVSTFHGISFNIKSPNTYKLFIEERISDTRF